jgi:hypothetical protein
MMLACERARKCDGDRIDRIAAMGEARRGRHELAETSSSRIVWAADFPHIDAAIEAMVRTFFHTGVDLMEASR